MFLEIILFDRNNLLSRNHFISPSNLGQWKEEEEDLDCFSLDFSLLQLGLVTVGLVTARRNKKRKT